MHARVILELIYDSYLQVDLNHSKRLDLLCSYH